MQVLAVVVLASVKTFQFSDLVVLVVVVQSTKYRAQSTDMFLSRHVLFTEHSNNNQKYKIIFKKVDTRKGKRFSTISVQFTYLQY